MSGIFIDLIFINNTVSRSLHSSGTNISHKILLLILVLLYFFSKQNSRFFLLISIFLVAHSLEPLILFGRYIFIQEDQHYKYSSSTISRAWVAYLHHHTRLFTICFRSRKCESLWTKMSRKSTHGSYMFAIKRQISNRRLEVFQCAPLYFCDKKGSSTENRLKWLSVR